MKKYNRAILLVLILSFTVVPKIYALTFSASQANPALKANPQPIPLVGFWHLNEGAGFSAVDSSPYNNNGAVSNTGAAWVPGHYGNGLNFSGDPNGRVIIPDSNSLHLQSTFTIMAWVKPASLAGPAVVISKYTGPPAGTNITFSIKQAVNANNGKWEIDTTFFNLWSNLLIQVGVWQHLAVTYDGNIAKLYINGILDNSVVVPGGIFYIISDPVIIGGQNGTINDRAPYNGTIDEVRIYNKALTQPQVVNDMNTP